MNFKVWRTFVLKQRTEHYLYIPILWILKMHIAQHFKGYLHICGLLNKTQFFHVFLLL